MPGEKEYNGYLFDQLSAVERIERQLEKGGVEAANEEIETLKTKLTASFTQSRHWQMTNAGLCRL